MTRHLNLYGAKNASNKSATGKYFITDQWSLAFLGDQVNVV